MMGSDAVDIDGITKTGEVIPVMRKGEWGLIRHRRGLRNPRFCAYDMQR